MSAFSLLLDIEARSRRSALPLPQQEEVKESWRGVGFTLSGRTYAASMSDVVEIIPLPKLTSVPGVASWLLGVANIRGELVPVSDLRGMLDIEVRPSKEQRVLVVAHNDSQFGLLVDSVLGMQNFSLDQRIDLNKDLDDPLSEFIPHGFNQGGRVLSVIDLSALTRSQTFLSVAS